MGQRKGSPKPRPTKGSKVDFPARPKKKVVKAVAKPKAPSRPRNVKPKAKTWERPRDSWGRFTSKQPLSKSVSFAKQPNLSPHEKRTLKKQSETLRSYRSQSKKVLAVLRSKGLKKRAKRLNKVMNVFTTEIGDNQRAILGNTRPASKRKVVKHDKQLAYFAKRTLTAGVGTPTRRFVSGGVFFGGNLIAYDADFYPESGLEDSRSLAFSVGEAVTDLEGDTNLTKTEWVSASLVFSFDREDYEGGKEDEGPTRKHKRLDAKRSRVTLFARRIMHANHLVIVASDVLTLIERMFRKRPDAKLDRLTVHYLWNAKDEQPAGF